MRSRDRRALRAGAAIAVLAVVLLRLLPAVWAEGRSTWQTFSGRAELLGRARSSVLREALLEDSSAVIKTRVLGLAAKLLGTVRESEAVAELASRLQRAAGANRVRLERISPVPDSGRAGALRRVSLAAELEGDTRGTLQMLQALAKGPTAVTVTELEIVAINPRGAETIPEELRTTLTLRAWYVAQDPDR